VADCRRFPPSRVILRDCMAHRIEGECPDYGRGALADGGGVVIWAILALAGGPLWLCALGIFVLVNRNRQLQKRHGDIPARVLCPGKTRWVRGHAPRISDVFAWRGSPAGWNEGLFHGVAATAGSAEPGEQKALPHLGDIPAVVALTADDGRLLRVAADSQHWAALMGPYPATAGRSTLTWGRDAPSAAKPRQLHTKTVVPAVVSEQVS